MALGTLLPLLAAGCASALPEPTLYEQLRGRGLDPERLVHPTELTPEMRAWAHAHDNPGLPDEERLEALLAALLADEDLDLRYRREITGTAREVFASGEANCLSFTNLFVGMAREIGLPVYFLAIRRPPSFDLEGDLAVVWEHVTAGWGEGPDRMVLEFERGPIDRRAPGERLSDLTALAMFYTNRGAEQLLADDPEEALVWLETAVRLDPTWSDAWVNLGVVRRRLGDPAGAEAAYRAGIEADPDELQLYSNLATLLRERGEPDTAGELLELLDRRRSRNPYVYLALGDEALREDRLDDARRFYRRAVRRGEDSAETRAAIGLWELASGRPDRARRSLRRAEALGPGAGHLRLLRERLAATGEGAAELGGPDEARSQRRAGEEPLSRRDA